MNSECQISFFIVLSEAHLRLNFVDGVKNALYIVFRQNSIAIVVSPKGNGYKQTSQRNFQAMGVERRASFGVICCETGSFGKICSGRIGKQGWRNTK
jgi:hypothetical protein